MTLELIEKVWSNANFHEASRRIELAWLRKELGAQEIIVTAEEASKLIRAAAILSCSSDQLHRKAAFRVATCTYELFGALTLPLDQALRVVLARLGNFPSFSTRSEVAHARPSLPLILAAEEIASADGREIVVNQQKIYLTDFQHDLWTNLVARKRIALAAPTSAGKSYVLQNYLSSLFAADRPQSVVYLVPTRALIGQVAEDLATQFQGFAGQVPDIVTIPIDAETALPTRAIYVMTQERIQLALAAHPDFNMHVVVVDEAHSIADGARGVLLQWVIDDLLARNPEIQILFASPSIRNLGVFARLFGLPNVVEFMSVEPTVAQNFLTLKIDSATKGRIVVHTIGDGSAVPVEVISLQLNQTIASRVEKLVHVAARFGIGQSNIVYANGAAEAEKIAIQLADLFSDREPTTERLALAELAKEAVHPNYVLVECVKRGIAFHYSNIPTQLRRAVEAAVSSGYIDYLVCTSTLLQGVNLPAKNIFMYAPEKGRTNALESTDFWNLSGRAGRLRREFQGNIFLIDYANWKKKPLDGPKDSIVVPAIETSVREHEAQLVTVIVDQVAAGLRDQPDLETAFGRLYSDHKRGELSTTFARIGIAADGPEAQALSAALIAAEAMVSIPAEILRRTPNISAHKQQRLFARLKVTVGQGVDAAKTLIPRHPRESEAFQSYAAILELCHEIILGIDTSKGLHRFHALMALKWMRGLPLPQIIDEQIKRDAKKAPQTIIRNTLDLIETEIRFQAVRLFGCYNALLVYALDSAGMIDLVASIPSLPLYLEVGASDKTMISFIALGLSRVTAMKLNELSARKDLDVPTALQWLRTRPPSSLGLSPLLLAEVSAIIAI
ncbi:MAG: DEAD/DEAH box helicase [Mesorhizobium sp.]|uniref:DEAD/DEAH box helicase n=1 Tax=Mesorhizobium sp. TaxID=1871066 RepID=UPI000FE7CD8A|nr:DEAD/DEAH box helicase [Mesorhizobium sp.]RWP78759.1 MAG: DEAD/DEAH box helicase [Mesorhizobium sp.]